MHTSLHGARSTGRERQQDAWRQNEEEEGNVKEHAHVKHIFYLYAEIIIDASILDVV